MALKICAPYKSADLGTIFAALRSVDQQINAYFSF